MPIENNGAASSGAAGGNVSDGGAGGGSTPAPSMEDTIRSRLSELTGGSGNLADNAGHDSEDDDAGSRRPAGTGRTPQPRAQNGRYASATNVQQGAASDGTDPNANPDAASDGTDPAQAATTPPVAKQPHDSAPTGWTKEEAADFANLPESARKAIHRREADFHNGIKQYRDAAQFGSSIATELMPYANVMKQHNTPPNEVVKTLGAIWNTLVTGSPAQKAQAVLQVIQDYSIDLSSLNGAPQPGNPAQSTQTDPELAALKQELAQVKSSLTAQENERNEAAMRETVNAVESFGKAVDSKTGKLLHPHFEAVRPLMAKLYQGGLAETLDDAYKQACSIHEPTQTALAAEREAERVAREKQQAANARKAAAANVTPRGTPPVVKKGGSMEDTIRAQLKQRGMA